MYHQWPYTSYVLHEYNPHARVFSTRWLQYAESFVIKTLTKKDQIESKRDQGLRGTSKKQPLFMLGVCDFLKK